MKTLIKRSGRLAVVFLVLIILVMQALPVYGYYPHTDYTYGDRNGTVTLPYGSAVPAPSAFEPGEVLSTAGGKELNTPTDVFYGPDKKLYLLDAGNNRILVLDDALNVTKTHTGFLNNGAADVFTNAGGLFVDDQLRIYVCDTDRARLIRLKADGSLDRIYNSPTGIEAVREDFQFKPVKVTVDTAGRIFLVNQGTVEGLVCISPEGKFDGFVGANRVETTPWELFWKTFSTKAQREQLIQFVPVEMSNVSIDPDGFLYATAKGDDKNQMIRKFNLNGIDILRTTNNNVPRGDISEIIQQTLDKQSSFFVDVAVYGYGIFTCLDSVRGHIFTYTDTGNLLFASGGQTAQNGSFSNVAAAEWMGDSLLVLDRKFNELTKLDLTDYGSSIVGAIKAQYLGDYDDASKKWEEVLKYNLNNELAYSGVGRALLKEGKYKEAMEYARLGDDRELYSKAFEFDRRTIVANIVPWVLGAFAILAVVMVVKSIVKGIMRYRDKLEGRTIE